MFKIVVVCLDLNGDKYITMPCDEITVDPPTIPGTAPSVTVYFNGEITGYFAHPVYAHVQEVDEDELEDDEDDDDEDELDDDEDDLDDEDSEDPGDDDNGGGGGGGDSGDGGPEPVTPLAGAPVPTYEVVDVLSGSANGSLDALESALSR